MIRARIQLAGPVQQARQLVAPSQENETRTCSFINRELFAVVSQVVYWTQNLSCDSSTVILSACMDSAHSETLLHLRLQNLESKQLPVCQGPGL